MSRQVHQVWLYFFFHCFLIFFNLESMIIILDFFFLLRKYLLRLDIFSAMKKKKTDPQYSARHLFSHITKQQHKKLLQSIVESRWAVLLPHGIVFFFKILFNLSTIIMHLLYSQVTLFLAIWLCWYFFILLYQYLFHNMPMWYGIT
jgi:hypothetical protein